MVASLVRVFSIRTPCQRALIWAGLAACLSGQALAQQNSLPINRPSSAFPKITLGGVKSKAPHGIGTIRGTLLPPPPVRVTPPPGTPRRRPESGARRPGDVGGRPIGDGRAPGTDRAPDRVRQPGDVRDSAGRNTPAPGVTIDGRYSDDRFRIGFHVGSAVRTGGRHGHGYPYGYPYRYFSGYGANSWYGDFAWPLIGGYAYPEPPSVPVMAPAAPPPPPPPPPTDIEKADEALRESRPKDAVKFYQDHLAGKPGDAEAARSLALALLLDKRPKEAVAVMIDVYEKHPGLAAQVIESENLPLGDASLRTLVLAVVPYANRTKTASGYLTTTVLLQAQGKTDAAVRLLKKAKDVGLDEKVATELEQALKR